MTTWARSRAMVTMMRVASNKEGEGSKSMAMATRVVGKQMATTMKRAMAKKSRLGGAGGGNDRPLCATRQRPTTMTMTATITMTGIVGHNKQQPVCREGCHLETS